MDPGSVLPALIVIALVLVLVPVGATAFAAWRRPVRLTCPQAGRTAQLAVPPLAAGVAALFGRNAHVARCSLWSAVRACHEECLRMPESARRPVPIGTPPPRPARPRGMHTILVPLDGTAGSEAVVPVAADLARVYGATVRLLRVVAPARAVRGEDGVRMLAYVEQEGAQREFESQAYLHTVGRRLSGLTVEQVVRSGDAARCIVAEAEACGADLIALASRRRLVPFARRSVAHRLRRATTIPLLEVRHGDRVPA
jgi:nucleotide-binding universal stress UspA family protein